ncbi:MAG: hypothetical protein R8K50_04435 [Mariprofundus sp.]
MLHKRALQIATGQFAVVRFVGKGQGLAPDKIRERNKDNADGDKPQGICDKIGEDHQGQAAEQRHNRPLALTVDKKANPD